MSEYNGAANYAKRTSGWIVFCFVVAVGIVFRQQSLAHSEALEVQKSADSQEQQRSSDKDNLSSDDPSVNKEDDWFNSRQDFGAWNPFEEMHRMRDEMNRMFEDSFSRLPKGFGDSKLFSFSDTTPDVDLKDDGDKYVFRADIPGADEATIKVSLENDLLKISAKRETLKEEESESKGTKVYHKERFVGSYRRALTLPGPVKEDEMKTNYRNGVLTVTIPKDQKSRMTDDLL